MTHLLYELWINKDWFLLAFSEAPIQNSKGVDAAVKYDNSAFENALFTCDPRGWLFQAENHFVLKEGH